ncbi:MAG: sulfite exporter TauE/SafE family protein [Pseudomonadota bacterium]
MFDFALFTPTQWIAILAIFVWSGFIRTGIGFGGAAFSLPLLLLVSDQPLFFLPIIALHLFVASAITITGRLQQIDWGFIRRVLTWLTLPKILGVIGLLSLPNTWLVNFVFAITLLYAINWILQRDIRYRSPWIDRALFVLGGYVSGASLVGSPLIAAVAIQRVALEHYRNTLFILWFILVSIKLIAFVVADVDLQWAWAGLLLIPAGIGHVLGLKAHHFLLHQDSSTIQRILGSALLLVALIGLYSTNLI